jgi:hypothetical protein
VLLGESIAPFRVLGATTCVVPVHQREILDSRSAADAGFRHLSAWLRDVEAKWMANASKRVDGTTRMTLRQQLDHMRKLSAQLSTLATRVVYAASGTLPAAVVVTDRGAIVEHAAYWAPARSLAEARYLTAILNSETARALGEDAQPKGQGGARHFDNLIWELPIPEYNRRVELHRNLATAAATAERVAAAVALTPGAYFMRQRRAIRDPLVAHGIARNRNASRTTTRPLRRSGSRRAPREDHGRPGRSGWKPLPRHVLGKRTTRSTIGQLSWRSPPAAAYPRFGLSTWRRGARGLPIACRR